ncbi:MAG: hypothetical protein ABW185_10825 [Sedimenticola sp.]
MPIQNSRPLFQSVAEAVKSGVFFAAWLVFSWIIIFGLFFFINNRTLEWPDWEAVWAFLQIGGFIWLLYVLLYGVLSVWGLLIERAGSLLPISVRKWIKKLVMLGSRVVWITVVVLISGLLPALFLSGYVNEGYSVLVLGLGLLLGMAVILALAYGLGMVRQWFMGSREGGKGRGEVKQ